MEKNTSVLLNRHFDNFIKEAIASGRYKSASEVVRTALRLLETEEQKIKNLRKALDNGEESGFFDDFNPELHLQELHKKKL
jgi:antitoxin ParD1/3/4